MNNDTPITVTLTADQWSALRFYLLITKKQRKETIGTWEVLAHDTKPDGTPRYPHAAGNAAYLRELDAVLDSIIAQT